ncbi:MAG: glutamate--tRNA ligase [Chitinispirillaceae bacterium]|nr:glutamate--tRNA ligase [Chitinispirillaceae bacterium]
MMTDEVRVRFAPSPTGYLHVGGARSALFNYLFAKRHRGTFILRIEDTDRNRFIEEAMREIYESLKWLGITWDEGPETEGSCGPYIQSERLEQYRTHAELLAAKGHAYRCFCSPERLATIRGEQEKKKGKLGYDGFCRTLSDREIQSRLASGMPYVIRFKIPSGRCVRFNDLIRGTIEYRSDLLDDFVLLKTDGYPTYHLANVVDDHLMRISHVLRGDEWIASTPRHVLLYEAFGWSPPSFAHLPIILSSNGGKLSKRKGAASVMDYKRAGYLPEALFNFLALLGWAPGEDREKMNPDEMIASFSIEQISPKASVFDEKKLEWMNGLYMAERPVASLTGEVVPLLREKGWLDETAPLDTRYIEKMVLLLRERSKRLSDLVAAAHYFFIDPVAYDEKAEKKYFPAEAADHLLLLDLGMRNCPDFTRNSLEELFRKLAESKGIPAGTLIHPARLAVSGVSFGPGLFELLETLGRERVLRRIENAVAHIRKKATARPTVHER